MVAPPNGPGAPGSLFAPMPGQPAAPAQQAPASMIWQPPGVPQMFGVPPPFGGGAPFGAQQVQAPYQPPAMVSPSHADPLGLGISAARQERPACSLIFYGPVGLGKSTEIGKAFNKCLFVGFRENFLWDYERWFHANADQARGMGLTIPAFKVIPKYRPDGRAMVDTVAAVEEIFFKVAQAQSRGNCPYTGIVVDEGNAYGARVEEEIRGRRSDGSLNATNYSKIDRVKEQIKRLIEWPSATKLSFVMIGHEMPPFYDQNGGKYADDGTMISPPSPTFGQLLLPGGPKMPYKTLPDEVCQSFDMVLHGSFGTLPAAGGGGLFAPAGGGSERVIYTQPTQKWAAKCHGATAAGIGAIERWDVRSIVERAGFHV